MFARMILSFVICSFNDNLLSQQYHYHCICQLIIASRATWPKLWPILYNKHSSSRLWWFCLSHLVNSQHQRTVYRQVVPFSTSAAEDIVLSLCPRFHSPVVLWGWCGGRMFSRCCGLCGVGSFWPLWRGCTVVVGDLTKFSSLELLLLQLWSLKDSLLRIWLFNDIFFLIFSHFWWLPHTPKTT